MTETQREGELLSDLLLNEGESGATGGYVPAHRHESAPPPQPTLTLSDERNLLHAANEVGTPTLAPRDLTLRGESAPSAAEGTVADFVRRYPIPAVMAAVGVGYVIGRRM